MKRSDRFWLMFTKNGRRFLKTGATVMPDEHPLYAVITTTGPMTWVHLHFLPIDAQVWTTDDLAAAKARADMTPDSIVVRAVTDQPGALPWYIAPLGWHEEGTP